ncbi:MAG: alcohol dehydrogenase catalytic domain-containing protein [bacterium]|nr:alcohol dehydrogenase catalytic domain-containing protein [bacterium]
MRALIVDSGQLRLEKHYPDPVVDETTALVQPTCMGICDTDLQLLRGYMDFSGVLGHEFVGVVCQGPEEWLGKRVVADINFACQACDWCARGQQHHCPQRTVMGILNANGVFAESVAIPVSNLLAVPDSVSDDQAVFTEPLAAAFEILEQVSIGKTERVLVLGDGKLGLLCAQAVATTGASVTVWGHHQSKLDRIADRVHGVISPDWEGRPFDVVVEATGTREGLQSAIASVRPKGTVVLKSTVADAHQLSLAPIVIDEILLVGSRCGPFQRALQALDHGEVDVNCLVDYIFEFDQAIEAFEHAGRRGVLKVLLKPELK